MTHDPHDTPHDTLVKRFFKHPEHVLGILQAALPTTFVSNADWSTLALCSSSLIDRRSRARHGDLLFSVRMRGSRRLVYILLEHQSTFDRSLPWRTRGYEDGIWIWLNRGRKRVPSLPRILTVVLYHGARPWHGPVRLSDLFDTDGQDLDQDHPRLFLIDVPRRTDLELRGMGTTAIARLILFCLKRTLARVPCARRGTRGAVPRRTSGSLAGRCNRSVRRVYSPGQATREPGRALVLVDADHRRGVAHHGQDHWRTAHRAWSPHRPQARP